MIYNHNRAKELLLLGTGIPNVNFREDQENSIRFIVEGRGRLLVVQKTGWGKSIVYFISVKLLREQGMGPALLISPLLALMRNQIEAARRMGLTAETINSTNNQNWNEITGLLLDDRIDVLLISPERLNNPDFKYVLNRIIPKISMLIVDEAHCISDWGHDFRPDYRMITNLIKNAPPNIRLIATTATANDRVMDDLRNSLGPDLYVSRGDLNRESLTLQTIYLKKPAERMAWLAEQLNRLNGSGIIYTLTIRDAEQVTAWLKHKGYNVESYYSGTMTDREQLENDLLNNRIKALVATSALGMGFDKPDISFVIHYQAPGSVITYYQQVGRAGRSLKNAYGILLYGIEEEQILDYFINAAFPTRQEVSKIIEALSESESTDGLNLYELEERINLSETRIQHALTLLSYETPAPVVNSGTRKSGKWQLTVENVPDSFWQRVERIKQIREHEREQMEAYKKLRFGEHMSFLINALDGDIDKVSKPGLSPLPETVNSDTVKEAEEFFATQYLPIEPRKKWPNVLMPVYNVKGNINEFYQAGTGRCLCSWGAPGWGELIKNGKYQDNYFSDSLVDACCKLLQEWKPDPYPQWVTCVPSLRRPALVPDFSRRLADRLGLPFYEVIQKTEIREEQKLMENSIKQLLNLDGSLIPVPGARAPTGPVLLVDDMVDSRWTFTVMAWLLRSIGSGVVWPLALANTGHK